MYPDDLDEEDGAGEAQPGEVEETEEEVISFLDEIRAELLAGQWGRHNDLHLTPRDPAEEGTQKMRADRAS